MKRNSLRLLWLLGLSVMFCLPNIARAESYVLFAYVEENGVLQPQIIFVMGTPDTTPIVMGTPDGTPIVMGTPDADPIVMGTPDSTPIVMGTPDTDPIQMGSSRRRTAVRQRAQ